MSSENVDNTLYQKREPIFTRSIKGKFRTFKSSILFLAYAVFFILPWIPWQRYGDTPNQAILFDIPNRIYYLFDLPVNIQNIMWLAGVLILFAFTLFAVTAVLGRVFCGYFCFQTLWTDAFIMIESLIQGNRNARKKLYEQEWNSEKIRKVGLTWIAWFGFALWSGFTFTAYWTYAPQLLVDFFTGKAAFAAYATTGLLTITTFTMAGFAREQVCTFMCPYARFQGVMFDADTLLVSYDTSRGERENGRAKPMIHVDGERVDLRDYNVRKDSGYGDCIDCGLCVDVCPAGIDIREGISYKCITCGLCIDACHNMMTSLSYPTGLIRYASENGLQGGKTHYLRPRNIGYGIVILIITGILLWSVSHRELSYVAIEHSRSEPTALSSGEYENRYTFRLNNRDNKNQIFNFSLKDQEAGIYYLQLRDSMQNFVVSPGTGNTLTFRIRAKIDPTVTSEALRHHAEFIIQVRDEASGNIVETHEIQSRFDDFNRRFVKD